MNMKTAIVYYSKHHSNTKKILDALKEEDPSIELIDVTSNETINLSEYDRIGLASGIYFSSYAKQVLSYAEKNLPVNKDVFFIYTHGAPIGGFLKSIKRIVKAKGCRMIGKFHCRGYDTYVLKKFGGISKGRPNDKDIVKAIEFYKCLLYK